MCATTQTIGVSQMPWAVVYADGRTYEPSNLTYNQFPSPAYPLSDRTVLPGRCVRGWITFPVPANERPAMVEYQPQVTPVVVVDWKIS